MASWSDLPAMSAAPPHRRDDIRRRIARCARLTTRALHTRWHFGVVLVLIVDAAHPANFVAKATLGNVGAYARAARQRSESSAQVVECANRRCCSLPSAALLPA